MKKQISALFGSAIRRNLVRFGLTGLMAVNLVPTLVQAQDKIRTAPPSVSVSYIGAINNQPVFQIEFENKTEEVYSLSIRDEQGTILFNEKVKGKKFSKKFQFDKSGVDNMKLTFTLAGEKEKQSQTFEVNTNVRVVQDLVVTRITPGSK